MADASSPSSAADLVEVVFGPVIISALGPLQSFLAWVKANPNADKLTAAAQFNAFLAAEQVAVLQGGGGGAANLAAIAAALAAKLQADVQAKIAAATAALASTAAPAAPAPAA